MEEKKHVPGVTELRLNVHSAIENIKVLFTKIETNSKQIKSIENNSTGSTADIQEIKKDLQFIKTKLYENGIR